MSNYKLVALFFSEIISLKDVVKINVLLQYISANQMSILQFSTLCCSIHEVLTFESDKVTLSHTLKDVIVNRLSTNLLYIQLGKVHNT